MPASACRFDIAGMFDFGKPAAPAVILDPATGQPVK